MGHLSEAMDRAKRGEANAVRPVGNTQTPAPDTSALGKDTPVPPVTATGSWNAVPGETLKLRGATAESPVENQVVASLGIAGGGQTEGLPTPSIHQTDLTRVDGRLVGLLDPTSVMAEEYRSIRTSILARWQNRRHLVHTITSGTPQEGKTITSLNLGLIFAELRNRRVIVVEADLRLPQFANLLGLDESKGLTDVLEDKATLSESIHRVGESALHVLPAGHCAHDQAVQLLSGNNSANLIPRLRRMYDHVIIDTPPVVELADAGILGALSDEVMLIVRMDRTPKPLFQQAVRVLQNYNAPIGGIIATDRHEARSGYYHKYGYRYRYRYRYRQKNKAA